MAEKIVQAKLKKTPTYVIIPFICTCLAYMTIYVGMSLVQQSAVQLKEWFGVGDTKLSLIGTALTLALGICELLGASLVMKIGAKKVCMMGLAIHVVAGVLFLTKPTNFFIMILLRILQGCGAGFVSCCVMSLAIVWFPRRQRSIASGIMACMYGLANILCTNGVTGMYLNGWEWNKVFCFWLAVVNVIVFALFLFVYKDIEKKYGCTNIDEIMEGSEFDETATVKVYENKKFKIFDNYRDMFRSGAFWTFMIPIFLYCWVCYSLAFVLPLLLTEKGYSAEDSAAIQSLTFLGAIIGSPIGGIISDRFFKGRRALISGIGFLGCGILLATVPYAIDAGASNLTLSLLCLGAYLVMHFAAGPQWVMPNEMCTPKFGMALMGISLILTKIGGIIGPIVSGWISDSTGSIMPAMWVMVAVCAIFFAADVVLAKKWDL